MFQCVYYSCPSSFTCSAKDFQKSKHASENTPVHTAKDQKTFILFFMMFLFFFVSNLRDSINKEFILKLKRSGFGDFKSQSNIFPIKI